MHGATSKGNQHLQEEESPSSSAAVRRARSTQADRQTHQDEKATASRGHSGFQPACTRQGHFVFSFFSCLFLSDKKFPSSTMPLSDGPSSSYHLIGRLNHDSFYLFLSFVVGFSILSLCPFPFGCPVCGCYIAIVCALPWSSSFCSVFLWLVRCLILFS